MTGLAGQRIVLGVTGGIAAYKSAELVRLLRGQGAEVRVVMTPAAAAFISPLTLQALSGQPVRTELIDARAEAAMGHIELARWADRIVVAPASADFLARLRAGMADDLLATLCLASAAPIAVAPAMNAQMWAAPATRENVAALCARGVDVLGPGEGDLACGESGPGRMLEPAQLVEALCAPAADAPLAGLAVLVTAGPTREPLDPVRYLTNRSSGKMGFAVAAAAARAGARVTLVAGPVHLDTPAGVERVDVESAEQMYAAVQACPCDIFIGAAAVADYRPAEAAVRKLKKGEAPERIELVRNPDIVAAVAARRPHPFTVGFAAETDELERYARAKLQDKGLDMIAANWVGGRAPGLGFDSDENALEVFWDGGRANLARAPKQRVAESLVTLIAERRDATTEP